MAEMIHNPMLWVTISFLGFIALAMKLHLHKKVAHRLDGHGELIRMELDAAKKLRQDAQDVLAEYKTKQAQMLQEAQDMLANAKQEAEALRANAHQELTANLDARMQAAMKRIEQQEQQALKEVRDHVVDVTIAAAKEQITGHYAALSSEQMVAGVVADLDRKVH